jgi:hypothetical protein
MIERQVPALLKAKFTATDEVTTTLTKGLQKGYMILSEFENDMSHVVVKVFPKESSAKAYAGDQQIIKVNVVREFT